ncbi:MAG: hypothetical protein KDA72_21915 [Planctomycetales bacterium]|nr:hypothetical protein [Planctomycetales bacterium]
MSEAIFAAGCDDATVGSRDVVAFALIARQAASLEQAVRSALSQLQAAGYSAKEIIMEAARFRCRTLPQLANRPVTLYPGGPFVARSERLLLK